MGSPPPRHRGRCANSTDESGAFGRFSSGTRGQSTTLEYTLALAMASLVVTGLFVAATDFVSDQRTGVIRTELGVVGQQLASDVAGADRLVQAGDDPGRLSLNASLPSNVAGAQYSITVADAGGGEWLNLTTTDPSVSVSIRVDTETDVAPGAVDGGPVRIVYVPGTGLEVRG